MHNNSLIQHFYGSFNICKFFAQNFFRERERELLVHKIGCQRNSSLFIYINFFLKKYRIKKSIINIAKENTERDRNSVNKDSEIMTRKHAIHYGVAKSLLQKIVKKDLSLLPYKIQIRNFTSKPSRFFNHIAANHQKSHYGQCSALPHLLLKNRIFGRKKSRAIDRVINASSSSKIFMLIEKKISLGLSYI